MHAILTVFGWMAMAFGAVIWSQSNGAIQEIAAMIAILIGMTGLGFGATLVALHKLAPAPASKEAPSAAKAS